jgi:hypothetical protein
MILRAVPTMNPGDHPADRAAAARGCRAADAGAAPGGCKPKPPKIPTSMFGRYIATGRSRGDLNFPYFGSNTESSNAVTGHFQAGSKSSDRAPPAIENRKVPARGSVRLAKSGPTAFSAVWAYNPSSASMDRCAARNTPGSRAVVSIGRVMRQGPPPEHAGSPHGSLGWVGVNAPTGALSRPTTRRCRLIVSRSAVVSVLSAPAKVSRSVGSRMLLAIASAASLSSADSPFVW